MTLSNAVRRRVQALCAENGVTTDGSAVCAEIFRALEEDNVSILLIKRLCDALGMPLRDFFADPLFTM